MFKREINDGANKRLNLPPILILFAPGVETLDAAAPAILPVHGIGNAQPNKGTKRQRVSALFLFHVQKYFSANKIISYLRY